MSTPEPNQLTGVENCAIGNSSTINKKKWGWADTDCNSQYVFICKYQRGWPQLRAPRFTALTHPTLPCPASSRQPHPMCCAGGDLSLPHPHAHPTPPPPPVAPRVFYYERNLSVGTGPASRRRLLGVDSSAAGAASLGLTSIDPSADPAAMLAVGVDGDVEGAAGRQLLQAEVELPVATYILNQKYMRQDAAEKWCVDQGGHLASYMNLEEQVGAPVVLCACDCQGRYGQHACQHAGVPNLEQQQAVPVIAGP